MKETAGQVVTEILQSIGYTVNQVSPTVIEAEKKKPLKLVVVDDWSFENFEEGLNELMEIRDEEAYCAIIAPNTELGTGCMQPIEVMKKHHQFIYAHNLNVWGVDICTKVMSLFAGNTPSFDFKLMKGLMDNKMMNGLARVEQLGTIDSFKRQRRA
ncbi:MAG: hypothetical protein HYS70_06650 [Nitrospinae bacterium]|nr:hypothetical protein [Nitrospinota bacterium]